MAVKVNASDFAYEVNKILGEYQRGLYTQLGPTMRKTANETRKVLRSTSPKRTGKYGRGWEYELKVNSRLGGGSITLYDARPGLTHLLEKGHVTRNGLDRSYPATPAHPNIAAAQEQAEKQFLENLQTVLGEAPMNIG